MKFLASLVCVAVAAEASARQSAQISSVTTHATAGSQVRVVHAADFDGNDIVDVLVAHSAESQNLALLSGLGQQQFAATVGPVATGARVLVSGRFNADSQRDAAWLRSNGTVMVVLGTGTGAFGPATNVGTIAGGTTLVAGDVDNDGKLDLVVTSTTSLSAHVLFGDGQGGFTAGASVPCGAMAAFAQLGKLNGDAYRDLAVANLGTPMITVLFNSAAGFGASLTVAMPNNVLALDLGDVDADGDVDLVACTDDSVAIALGDGTGAFATPISFVVGAGIQRIVVMDATGDGLLDVVASRASAGRLQVLENRGGANFALGASVPVALNVRDMTVGDFDGDGHPDVALATNSAPDDLWVAWGPLQSIHDITRMPAIGAVPSELRLVDVDGDGDRDLLVCATTNGFQLWRNVGGNFQPAVSFIAHDSVSTLEARDLDGDGRLDVIGTNDFHGYADVFAGNANGTFSLMSTQRCGRSPVALALADFDGDGVVDCAAANGFHDNVSVRKGIGDGTFFNMVEYPTGISPLDIVALDVEGDGDFDLAVSTFGSTSPGLELLRNDGSGVFTHAGTIDPQISHQVKATDLDADGDTDLLLCNLLLSGAKFLLNDGHGNFTPLDVPGPGSYPRTIAAADLDGDGDLDVVLGNAIDDTVTLIEQYTPAQWRYAGQEPVGNNPMDVDVGDIDGDGTVDLVVANFYSSDVYVLKNVHASYGDVEGYCTAKVNSLGCTPELEVTGVPSASSPLACTVRAALELNQTPGIFLYGTAAAATPFGGGFLCVAAPLRRTPVQNSGGNVVGSDCSGSYAFDWNELVRSGADPALTAGSTNFAQFWSRDGASASPVNLTTAVKLVTAP